MFRIWRIFNLTFDMETLLSEFFLCRCSSFSGDDLHWTNDEKKNDEFLLLMSWLQQHCNFLWRRVRCRYFFNHWIAISFESALSRSNDLHTLIQYIKPIDFDCFFFFRLKLYVCQLVAKLVLLNVNFTLIVRHL